MCFCHPTWRLPFPRPYLVVPRPLRLRFSPRGLHRGAARTEADRWRQPSARGAPSCLRPSGYGTQHISLLYTANTQYPPVHVEMMVDFTGRYETNGAKVLYVCVFPVPTSTSNGRNSACTTTQTLHPGTVGKLTRRAFQRCPDQRLNRLAHRVMVA